jgi:hypothetical protein
MQALHNWLKEQYRASQAVTCEAPSHRIPQARGRPVVGLTDTNYLRLLMSTQPWP